MSEPSELAKRECVPCKGGVPPLKGKELHDLWDLLGHDWLVVDEHHLGWGVKVQEFHPVVAQDRRPERNRLRLRRQSGRLDPGDSTNLRTWRTGPNLVFCGNQVWN